MHTHIHTCMRTIEVGCGDVHQLKQHIVRHIIGISKLRRKYILCVLVAVFVRGRVCGRGRGPREVVEVGVCIGCVFCERLFGVHRRDDRLVLDSPLSISV